MELWQLMNTYGNPTDPNQPNPYANTNTNTNPTTVTPAQPSTINSNQSSYPSYSYPNPQYNYNNNYDASNPNYNYGYNAPPVNYTGQTSSYFGPAQPTPYQNPNVYNNYNAYSQQPQQGNYYQQNQRRPYNNNNNQWKNQNRNNNNNNNKPQQQQPPANKGKAAQAKFRCEVCDKDYNNETFYQKHVQGHTNCDTQGCTFVGSKSAVLVHQLRVHNPRYSEAFKLLESPEGLSKYLEQRKKNFPTKDNVKRKDEDLQLKIERGEIVVETKRFRDQRGRFREKKVLKQNKNYNNNNNNTSNVTTNATSMDSTAATEPIEEGELPEERTTKEDPVSNITVMEQQNQDLKQRKRNLCKHFKKGYCDRGDQCAFLHDESLVPHKKQKTNKPVVKKTSLLEKLLERDVLNEKSVILQCFRHIIQNHFFCNNQSTNRKDVQSEPSEQEEQKEFEELEKETTTIMSISPQQELQVQ